MIINPFICLDCEQHYLNYSNHTVCCKKQSNIVGSWLEINGKSSESVDERIKEIIRLDRGIRHTERGLFNHKAYQKDQDMIRCRSELLEELKEEADEKKQKDEKSRIGTEVFLSKLNITNKTVFNYREAYNYVYNSIYNKKIPN